MAQLVRPFDQSVPHAHPVIEDKTFTLPKAFVLRHVFKVLQDPAFEVKHLFHPLTQQVVGGFFAPDAPGTEHSDALVVEPVLVGLPPCGKLAKRPGFRVHGAFECAYGDLIVVTSVDHRHIRRADQRVPILGRDVVANLGPRVHVGLTHGDDLFFQPNFHTRKWRFGRGAFLPLQIRTARQPAQMHQRCVDPGAGPRDSAIHPLARQQQSTLDAFALTKVQQRPA